MLHFAQSVYRCARTKCPCADRIVNAGSHILRVGGEEYETMEKAVKHQQKCKQLSPWPTDILYEPENQPERK